MVAAAPTSLPFLFSCYLTLVLSSSPYLNLSGRNCPLSPPILSGYNEFQDTRFSRVTTWLMSWPDGERYLRPLQSLVVSLLLSTLVFSQTEGLLSHLNSSTHRFFRFPLRNLRSIVTLAVFSLVLAATVTASVKLLSFRIGRIENPSGSTCRHLSQDTSHLILYCPATDSLRRSLFGDSLSLYGLWSRPWEVPGFWGSIVFCHAPLH